jgi:hypothetical protein
LDSHNAHQSSISRTNLLPILLLLLAPLASAQTVVVNPTATQTVVQPAGTAFDVTGSFNVTGNQSNSGLLTVRSNPSSTAAGTAGIYSVLGPPGFAAGNPAANNPVSLYCATDSTNFAGFSLWCANFTTVLENGSPNVSTWGLEVDTDIAGTNPITYPGPYTGIDSVSGSFVPPTYAFRAYASNVSGDAVWKYGYFCGVTELACFEFQGPDPGLTITQNVTGSLSPQAVTTSAAEFAHIQRYQTISVDTGANQEDVQITNISGNPYSVTGIFAKSHTSGAQITGYEAFRLWDPNQAVTNHYPYFLGDLQAYGNSHTPAVLGWSMNDNTGTERLYDYFQTATNQRTFRDTGTGWGFQNSSGAGIGTIASDGTLLFPISSFPEMASPGTGAGKDICYGDSTAHALKCSYNGAPFQEMTREIVATSVAFATATTAGTCVHSTTSVTGATTGMAVSVSPVSTPGVGAQWSAFVSSTNVVTINECAVATSAGGTIAFNIRVFP